MTLAACKISAARTLEVTVRYRIALHKADEGYSVSVPGLPGCWSQGATEEEAVENIRDAIREYLSVVEEQLRGEDVREIEVSL
jgi:predicted RNase H-like HicB family nuclease